MVVHQMIHVQSLMMSIVDLQGLHSRTPIKPILQFVVTQIQNMNNCKMYFGCPVICPVIQPVISGIILGVL